LLSSETLLQNSEVILIFDLCYKQPPFAHFGRKGRSFKKEEFDEKIGKTIGVSQSRREEGRGEKRGKRENIFTELAQLDYVVDQFERIANDNQNNVQTRFD